MRKITAVLFVSFFLLSMLYAIGSASSGKPEIAFVISDENFIYMVKKEAKNFLESLAF